MDQEPSTVLPPLKAITASDHGGVLAIATSLGLVFGIISLLIRTYVRIDCRAAFGRDDYTALASMVVALVQAVVVFLAIADGFGKIDSDLTAAAMDAWQRDMFASDLLYVAALWLTKSSIALLLMRLSRDPVHGVMARVLLAASAVYCVVALFVVSLRCDYSRPWDTTQSSGCGKTTYVRWCVATVLDVLTEVALFVGGFWLVRDLQLSWRKKSVVVVAYGLRLPVVGAAVARLYYVHAAMYTYHGADQAFHGIDAAVCTQVELAYAVIATTMPCLKPFMSALNTQYGGGNAFVLTQTSANGSAAQRSRGGNGTSRYAGMGVYSAAGSATMSGTMSMSTREKAKVRARAMADAMLMSGSRTGGGGGDADGSGNIADGSGKSKTMMSATLTTSISTGGSVGVVSSSNKARPSTESEKGILESSNNMMDQMMMPQLSSHRSHHRGHHSISISDSGDDTTFTTTNNAHPHSPRVGRHGAQSPTGVAVTTDITVTEEKSENVTGPPVSAAISYAGRDDSMGRIGNAR